MSSSVDQADVDAEAAVTATLASMYAAVLAGDRATFDSHIAPTATMWETEKPFMMRGLVELTDHRDTRDEHRPLQLKSLEPRATEITVRGDTAIARYLLVARGLDDSWSTFRVTDVFAQTGSDWQIVHHHAEHRDGDDEPGHQL